MPEPSPSTTPIAPCPTCGALNGAGFDVCIRCGESLTGAVARLREPSRRIDGTALRATKLLLAVNVLVFALQALTDLGSGESLGSVLFSSSAASAVHFGAIPVAKGVLLAEPYRLLSGVFVHFGALHLFMNMLALSDFGRVTEPAIGPARFTIAFVVTGIAGYVATAAQSIFFGGDVSLTAGASGAIFGIMGLVLGFLFRRGDPRWKQFLVHAIFFGVMFGFVVNAADSFIRINNTAHLGGLVAGVVFGIAYAPLRPSRSETIVNVLAVMALGASLVSLVLAQTSPTWRAFLPLPG